MRTLGTFSQSHGRPHPFFKNEIDAVLSQGELPGAVEDPSPTCLSSPSSYKEGGAQPRPLAGL